MTSSSTAITTFPATRSTPHTCGRATTPACADGRARRAITTSSSTKRRTRMPRGTTRHRARPPLRCAAQPRRVLARSKDRESPRRSARLPGASAATGRLTANDDDRAGGATRRGRTPRRHEFRAGTCVGRLLHPASVAARDDPVASVLSPFGGPSGGGWRPVLVWPAGSTSSVEREHQRAAENRQAECDHVSVRRGPPNRCEEPASKEGGSSTTKNKRQAANRDKPWAAVLMSGLPIAHDSSGTGVVRSCRCARTRSRSQSWAPIRTARPTPASIWRPPLNA